MTVSYNHQVATSKPSVLFKLLWRWKGSVWKAISIELAVWLVLYFTIYAIYRYGLEGESQKKFEEFIRFFDQSMKFIPLDFMLGFFVTIVVNRWGTVFQNLGMIDNIALFTSNYVTGSDERGRNYRRNIVRYCVLSQAMVFRDINMQVRKRFPTFETLVAAGFAESHEMEKFHSVHNRYAKYWVPLNWALTLLNRAKKEGRVDSDINEYMVAQEIRHFRTGLSTVWQHDWISLPVLYPQLVFLATHTYFVLALFARQFIIKKDQTATEVDLHFPIMTVCQFIFYMGWMKVAMALLNPMGEDDDDYDCNFLLDRNLTLSLGCADAHHDAPDMEKDQFWDNDQAQPLYSLQSALKRMHFFLGSAAAEDNEADTEEITMVPHPVNEKMAHRRYRKREVSVAPTPVNRQLESVSRWRRIDRNSKSPQRRFASLRLPRLFGENAEEPLRKNDEGISRSNTMMSGFQNIKRRFTASSIGRSRQPSTVSGVSEIRSRGNTNASQMNGGIEINIQPSGDNLQLPKEFP